MPLGQEYGFLHLSDPDTTLDTTIHDTEVIATAPDLENDEKNTANIAMSVQKLPVLGRSPFLSLRHHEPAPKGDKYNVIYGTIHRYSVPHYHRFGGGSVLGLPPRHKIDRDTSEGDAIVIKPDFPADRSRVKTKDLLAGLKKQRTKLLRVRPIPAAAPTGASEDYLPLSTSSTKFNGPDEDSEDDRYAYRSIRGKAKPEDMLPDDLEIISDSGSVDEDGVQADPDKEIKQRNVELSRGVERNPTDVESWLQLINHQESLLRGSDRESGSLTYAERKSLADIKLSLYEKALKRVGQHPSRDKLLLGCLEEGAKLWDTKKLSARWQSVLKSDSRFISLWIKYLDFRQTEFLDFTYEKCLATFMECLRLNKSSPDHPNKTLVHIYLFLRLTLFMREAGFMELAIGLWQAVLELTFFRPESLDERSIVALFLEFWDSEVARIGEAGAQGWKSNKNALHDPQAPSPLPRINSQSLFASWLGCERERIVGSRLPARSLDEEEDPYRVIISSDLEEILSLVWSTDSAHILVDGFLYFCHLPPVITAVNRNTTGHWAGDSFIQNDLMNSPGYALEDWLSRSPTSLESSESTPLSFPHQHFIHTLGTLFAEKGTWFYSFHTWAKAARDNQSDIDTDWARRVLRSLVEAMPQNDDLAEYTLALEFACNPKEAKKCAKSLLKKRSSNLRLYNAYALMERRSGNLAAADHVWATSLSMSNTFSDNDRVDSILLWHAWVWELLEARNVTHASHVLMSMPQNSIDLKAFPDPSGQPKYSATGLLKLQTFLAETLENLLANRKSTTFVACVDSQAILAYLTHSFDLNKTLDAYSNAMSRLYVLPKKDEAFVAYTTELLHQSRARLLYYHVRTNGIISTFPHNTMFLSLFAWSESRFRIEDRVRDIVRDITTESRTSHTSTMQQVPITSHLFSIYTEMVRPVYAGSTAHSVRAAFEKAIDDHDPSAQHNTLSTAGSSLSLWKLYILFELSHHNIQRAKDVFYRGMRACPWSKELIMLAFSHLRTDVVENCHPASSRLGDGMRFDELRRVYNVLVEKELRIHVDIEDQLDEVAEKMQRSAGLPFSMPDDADSGDEMQL
ncbi:NRDE-2, necessary for RNA interference-domain-containing protein [Aspergillus floccosus]